MTDFPAAFYAARHPSLVSELPRPPAVVYVAAVLTWIVATGTAALTLLLAVAVLWIAAPLFDSFEPGLGNPRWFVIGATAVVIVLSALADAAAVFVVRGRSWARWMLVGLSVVATLGGLISAYYIGPLLVTAASVTVLVLLLLPDAGAWFRATHIPDPT